MSESSSKRFRLPINPSIENLKKQAKRLTSIEPSLSLQQAQHKLAVQYGSKSWTDLLQIVEKLRTGATESATTRPVDRPLPGAANRSDLEGVRKVLAEGAFTQNDLDLALARAVLKFNKRREIAELLIEHGADPDGQYGGNYGPIVFVTGECHDPEGLQFLIDHGADVTFAPITTKYGPTSPMISTLGAYSRDSNDRKHRCIDILMKHNAVIPEEVTPPMLAIHRGAADTLRGLIFADPSLVKQTFLKMLFGNMFLRGGTLLHLAVEFCEMECVNILLDQGADINAPAEIVDGIGGQTSIFHTITNMNCGFPILEMLAKRLGKQINVNIRGTFRMSDLVQETPVSALEYAESAMKEDVPDWRRSTQKEVDLLRSIAG